MMMKGTTPFRYFTIESYLVFMLYASMGSPVRGLVVGFFFPGALSCPNRLMSIRRSMSSSLEVEEKFSLDDGNIPDLERKLRDLGFSRAKSTEMTDWYFDTTCYDFVRQDCWLRYREGNQGMGQWQLKIGQKDHRTSGTSTVYKELEGNDAVEAARDLVPSHFEETAGQRHLYEGYSIPEFPISDGNLAPFARIFTQRKSWKQEGTDDQAALIVDFDSTDFGYSVAEVEAVVRKKPEVTGARQRIREMIETLLGNETRSEPAVGKLEYYLERNRPEIYQILVESGVLRDKGK